MSLITYGRRYQTTHSKAYHPHSLGGGCSRRLHSDERIYGGSGGVNETLSVYATEWQGPLSILCEK